jgi:hypothetical protein
MALEADGTWRGRYCLGTDRVVGEGVQKGLFGAESCPDAPLKVAFAHNFDAFY